LVFVSLEERTELPTSLVTSHGEGEATTTVLSYEEKELMAADWKDTVQRFLECFEGLQALRHGDSKLRALVPGYRPTIAALHETTRAVMVAMNVLRAQLKKAT